MKKMKKIVALLIAMVMVLGMSTMAFAAQTEGTTASIKITTDSTLEGETANTYQAYKIFDASYDSLSGKNTQAAKDTFDYDKDTAVSYFMKTGNPWIATVQGMTDYFTVTAAADGSGYTVMLKEDVADTADTAKAIASALNTARTSLTLSGDYAGIDVVAGGAAVNVQPGYYLIASDTATNLQLITTDVELVEKNEYVNDEKVAETASVTVGESATYYIKVYIPANVNKTLPVVVHDDLAAELSFNNDVTYYIGETDPAADATTDAAKIAAYKALTYSELTDAYNVTSTGLTDGCDFEISINTTDIAGNYIIFKYTAELLAAASADGKYVNKEFTTYSNYETTPSTPEVTTYDFDIKKVDGEGTELEGAIFELRSTADGDPIQFFEVAGGYKKADTYDTTTVDATKVTDLEAGTILPSTGGIGTTIFYIVGAILVIGAGVVLVTRSRMNVQ